MAYRHLFDSKSHKVARDVSRLAKQARRIDWDAPDRSDEPAIALAQFLPTRVTVLSEAIREH